MALSLGAKKVPQVAWGYMGIIEFMTENPGMYGMDARRRDCHRRLCEHYHISRERAARR